MKVLQCGPTHQGIGINKTKPTQQGPSLGELYDSTYPGYRIPNQKRPGVFFGHNCYARR